MTIRIFSIPNPNPSALNWFGHPTLHHSKFRGLRISTLWFAFGFWLVFFYVGCCCICVHILNALVVCVENHMMNFGFKFSRRSSEIHLMQLSSISDGFLPCFFFFPRWKNECFLILWCMLLPPSLMFYSSNESYVLNYANY